MPLLAWPWGFFATTKQGYFQAPGQRKDGEREPCTCFQKGLGWAILPSLKLGFSQAELKARIQFQMDCNTKWEEMSEPGSDPASAQALSVKFPSLHGPPKEVL